MLAYVTLGADDLAAARRFYQAILLPLDFEMTEFEDGMRFSLGPVDRDGQYVFVVRPFDDQPASTGNGSMVAFDAGSQARVRDIHAAGLAAGGTDEGAPGFRADYSATFFVGYLRDPQGNKIALFSDDPKEPGRDA